MSRISPDEQSFISTITPLLNPARINENVGAQGNKALHIAASKNYLEATRLILQVPGVDTNAKGLYGFTALHFAALNSEPEMLKLLLSSKVSVDVLSTDGFTPLCIAAANANRPAIDALVKANADTGIITAEIIFRVSRTFSDSTLPVEDSLTISGDIDNGEGDHA